MIYVGLFIAGLLGFIIGEGFSAMFRGDGSGRENNSALTWVLKLIFAAIFMSIVLKSCS